MRSSRIIPPQPSSFSLPKTILIVLIFGEVFFAANGFFLRKLPVLSSPKYVANDDTMMTDHIYSVRNASCTLHDKPFHSRWRFWKPSLSACYRFDYSYNELALMADAPSNETTAILLIHPIGVGIGRWFYNRLLHSLYQRKKDWPSHGNVVILAPDLLACGSASDPVITSDTGQQLKLRKLPLLNITDWSQQIMQLMSVYEEDKEVNWCIVSNGGCVPIALDIGQRFAESSRHDFRGNLTRIVLSAPPRLTGLLQYPPKAQKVERSYRTLSGIVGKIFWWYALRKNGRFIQKFSERNLAADPQNLGNEWTPTCVETAKSYFSRYSTFAFLAGALQMSCQPAFASLRNSTISVDVILGGDKRRNPARR